MSASSAKRVMMMTNWKSIYENAKIGNMVAAITEAAADWIWAADIAGLRKLAIEYDANEDRMESLMMIDDGGYEEVFEQCRQIKQMMRKIIVNALQADSNMLGGENAFWPSFIHNVIMDYCIAEDDIADGLIYQASLCRKAAKAVTVKP